MSKLLKYIPYGLPLTVLKAPLFTPLRLNILLPLYGLFHLVNKKSLHPVTVYALIIVLLGLPACLLNFSWMSLGRMGQWILILCTFDYMLREFNPTHFKKMTRIVLIVSLIILIIEALTLGPHTWKTVLGFLPLPRFRGITGEINYSSAVSFGCFLVAFNLRDTKSVILAFALCLTSGSQTTVLLLLIFLLLFGLKKWLSQPLTYLYPIFLLLFPIGIYTGFHWLSHYNPELINKIDWVTSTRFKITMTYINIFLDHPFGVGYFSQLEFMGSPQYNQLMFPYVNEEHNTFMQILVQLGPLSFFATVYGVYRLLKDYCSNQESIITMITLFTYFMALNGTHEFILYFLLAFLVSKKARKQNSLGIAQLFSTRASES